AEANRVLDELRDIELARRGSIVIEDVAASISELAARAESHEPRKASSSPIWEEAEARIQARGVYPASWFVLMIIAGLIGALGIRPVSDLINSPNVFSVVVAVLAGIVGVVSLTEARANALIGVFISVTTIPAAADLGLSISFGAWREARGALFQLLLNVVILI